MPFLMRFALENEIVTFARIYNASVQFPLNIYATAGYILTAVADEPTHCGRLCPLNPDPDLSRQSN